MIEKLDLIKFSSQNENLSNNAPFQIGNLDLATKKTAK